MIVNKLKYLLPVITIVVIASSVATVYLEESGVQVLGTSTVGTSTDSSQKVGFFKKILIFLGLARVSEKEEARQFEYVLPELLKENQVLVSTTPLPVPSPFRSASPLTNFKGKTAASPPPPLSLLPPPPIPTLGVKDALPPPVPTPTETVKDFFGKIWESFQ